MRTSLCIGVAVVLVALGAAGCERDMRDMYDQNRPHADGQAVRFDDGRDVRPAPDGAISRASGALAAASSANAKSSIAPNSARALLQRGKDRYGIYCTPCHSPVGDGDGMVVRRGFPKPESFHTDKMRALSDADIDASIVAGYGAMRPMSGRIDENDRKAIVSYVRALQLSQHTPIGDVPANEREALERSAQ